MYRIGFLTNKRLLLALSGSIIATMLVIYWQPMQVIFKTNTSIGFDVWIRILLVSSAVVVAAEILKKFLRN
ncbi:MAG: cation transporting ATPase C-terminal domain-containing protein [Candidatus Methanoperedens sp.]|nr:cation transporting ATPase C-terminal domain-containing protein [Candidatus Methanoperedens sp.]